MAGRSNGGTAQDARHALHEARNRPPVVEEGDAGLEGLRLALGWCVFVAICLLFAALVLGFAQSLVDPEGGRGAGKGKRAAGAGDVRTRGASLEARSRSER